MIRQEQLDELHEQIAKDEQIIADLRLKRFIGSGATYAAAKGRIELATDALADLTAQYEAEQAALADRPNVEKAEAKYLDGAARALGKADDRVTAALDAAQKALVEVTDAVEARRLLMEQTAGELAAKGLTLRDDEGQPAHETGTERRLSGQVVRIRGRWWTPLQALDLLDWLKHRVTAARLPGFRPPFCGACAEVERRTDGPVGRVAAVPEVPRPEPVKMPQRPHMGAKVYISSVQEMERKIDSEELLWQAVPVKGPDGTVDYRREGPTEQAKQRAAQRKKALYEGVAAGRIIARH